MIEKLHGNLEEVKRKPYWSFTEIMDLATHCRFKGVSNNSNSSEIDEFKANLLIDLKEAILNKVVVPVDLVKYENWFERNDFLLAPFKKGSFLLGIFALVYVAQRFVDSLSTSEKAIIFKPGVDGSRFFQDLILRWPLTVTIGLVTICAIFLCYLEFGKRYSKLPHKKNKFLLLDAELRGFKDGYFESETVIDFLNARYALRLEKDPFRVWPEPFFRRNGDYWIVGYMGKRICLKNQKITETIAYLLDNPGKSFKCDDFVKAHPDNFSNHNSGFEPDYFDSDYNVIKNEFRSNKVNKKTVEDFLKILETEVENARDSGNTEAMTKAQDNVKHTKRYLRETFTRTGKEKPPSDQNEKARNSLKKAIDRFIDGIQAYHPSFAEHLRSSIERGYSPVYRPPEEVHWDVRFE